MLYEVEEKLRINLVKRVVTDKRDEKYQLKSNNQYDSFVSFYIQ